MDCVITEDSDLLAYGVKKVLFKWDRDTLEGDEIAWRALGGCTEIDLVNVHEAQFLNMCILAGCDYLKSLPGIGLKSAAKKVRKYGGNMDRFFRGIRSSAHKNRR